MVNKDEYVQLGAQPQPPTIIENLSATMATATPVVRLPPSHIAAFFGRHQISLLLGIEAEAARPMSHPLKGRGNYIATSNNMKLVRTGR